MAIAPTRPSADPTRAAIIDAARQCFVAKGFAGTAISAIATKAKVNQSLIYHHFGSKQALWVAVKIHILEDYHALQDMNWEKLLSLTDSRDFIAEFIRYRFGLFDRYPDVLRIIEWQYLEPNPFELSSYPPEKLHPIIERIHFFQEQNHLSSNYNPELIFSMLLALPLGFFRSFRDLSSGKPQRELDTFKNEYVELCIDTIIRGLLK
ncbi:MAG: TetR/AcrR family transcriptional regulator [Pseudomonadota bacterium]|nr:TetR/AcrR family transcriptional regulator [Pseudomonadota bacterium]